MGVIRNSDLKRPLSEKSNYMVVMFQLMQISLNIQREIYVNKRLFGVWGLISKRSA